MNKRTTGISSTYTQNYELECSIKYINIAYVSELLKLLTFQRYKRTFFFVFV